MKKPKSKTRRSFRQMFWKHHRVIELRINKKFICWFGIRDPNPTAQQLIDGEKKK